MNASPQKKPGGRVLSAPMLISVYAACAAIVAICVRQAVLLPDRRALYLGLCAVAVAYGAYITVMNEKNKKNPGNKKISGKK